MKQLREIWQENARLQKMLAKRDLEIDVMKRIAEKMAGARRRVANKPGLPWGEACRGGSSGSTDC